MSPWQVRAPGKAMLIGEYAVLDGAPAVVAAVDCYASATLPEPAAASSSPFIAEAMRQARAALLSLGVPEMAGTPLVDTSCFSLQGRKLGVGSSAAATVAAVGALFEGAGQAVAASRRRIQQAAAAAHDVAQGVRGSGADVLAATWGGVRAMNGPGQEFEGKALPVTLCFVATSQSTSTASLVARYREAEDRARPAIREMAAAAGEFLEAWREGDAAALIDAVETAFTAYLGLGHALGIALVTEEHAAIHRAARRCGGCAKPSGAGGGDLAVAFLPSINHNHDEEVRALFARELPAPLRPLSLQVSAQGVHTVWRT